MAGRDEVSGAFSTPMDNPLVPRFPITFRNVEIITVIYRTRPEAIRTIQQITARTLEDGLVHEVWTGPLLWNFVPTPRLRSTGF